MACYEDGYRNLTITPGVVGGFENPDGSRGEHAKWKTYPKTWVSPTLGQYYTAYAKNDNFYMTDSGAAKIQTKTSIQWKHGNSWYTTEHIISIGKWGGG